MDTLNLTYSPGVYKLTLGQRKAIAKFVEKKVLSNVAFIVNGFSSGSADHELNLILSTERARDVANFLIELSIPNDTILQRAFGERFFSGNNPEFQISQSVTIEAISPM